jgi:hypothetical protein
MGVFWTLGMAIFFGFSIKLLIAGTLFGLTLSTYLTLRLHGRGRREFR